MQEIGAKSGKIDRLIHLLDETQPHVVILSEHGLKESQIENTRLPKYSLKTHFSRLNHRKGGVAIYVMEDLKEHVEPLSISHYSKELICELAMIKITFGKEHLYVLGVYRTPTAQLDDALDTLSSTLEVTGAEKHTVIIMGDVNVNSLEPDRNTKKLNDALQSHNITRLPLPPTRITPTSKSSIDFICSNQHKRLKTKVLHAGIADHTAQLCEFQIQEKFSSNTSTMGRVFNRRNMDYIKEELKSEDWKSVFCAPTAEEAYKSLLSQTTAIMNLVAPVKKIRTKKKIKSTFANEEANNLKQVYLKCLRCYELTGQNEIKTEMVEAKKKYDLKLKSLRRQASADYIQQAENKSKATWQTINSQRKNKNTEISQMEINIDGARTKDTNKIACYLNSYFANIAEQTLVSLPKVINRHNTSETQTSKHDMLQLRCTDEAEIKSIVKSFKPKTSSGVDDISMKLLKHCSDALIPPLVNIINKSLIQGCFPSALKLSKVYPKFKKGCQLEASNYRPIALLPTFSKVAEKVVLTRLIDHCKQHNLLPEGQHGFIKGRSTTSALIKFVEFIIDNLEEKNLATTVLLDFSKAFDCLGHDLILNKLEHLGIKGQALRWFKSYLEGRQQIVELKQTHKGIIKKIRSPPLPTNRGVPQGSVLGPVLFILFTHDLPHYLGEYCTPLMYADDTTLLLAEKSTDTLAVKSLIALNMAYQYCHFNDLVVNEDKTKQLAFGKKKTSVPALPEVKMEEDSTFLGVIIDEDMSWNKHIDNLTSKLNSSLYALKRIKQTTDPATAKIAYHALFESHIRYGLASWGGTSAGNLHRILLLQKRAIRILCGLQARDSCREAFTNLRIMTVIALYIREVVLHVDGSMQTKGQDIHTHRTRTTSDYILPVHRTTLYEKKPSYIGMKSFNLLPMDIKHTQGKKLQTSLTEWLIQRPFYSLDEFLHWKKTDQDIFNLNNY